MAAGAMAEVREGPEDGSEERNDRAAMAEMMEVGKKEEVTMASEAAREVVTAASTVVEAVVTQAQATETEEMEEVTAVSMATTGSARSSSSAASKRPCSRGSTRCREGAK